jgi:DNA-binding response OmpR family regulator
LAQGNVLLIVDDAKESEVLKRQLISMDAVVFECADCESAKKVALERDYLCCIIHLKNNPLKGLEICSWIRSESIVPILMITSRDENVDEHMALRAGANDYMVSPVENRILVSRIHQQVNRSKSHEKERPESFAYGGFKMNFVSHEAIFDGREVPLTNTEFQLVGTLLGCPTKVFSRDELLKSAGLSDGLGSDHLLDTHLSRARKKIIEAGGPHFIHAVRGVGFRLTENGHK